MRKYVSKIILVQFEICHLTWDNSIFLCERDVELPTVAYECILRMIDRRKAYDIRTCTRCMKWMGGL